MPPCHLDDSTPYLMPQLAMTITMTTRTKQHRKKTKKTTETKTITRKTSYLIPQLPLLDELWNATDSTSPYFPSLQWTSLPQTAMLLFTERRELQYTLLRSLEHKHFLEEPSSAI